MHLMVCEASVRVIIVEQTPLGVADTIYGKFCTLSTICTSLLHFHMIPCNDM